MTEQTSSRVTAVVSTRDRGGRVVRTVRDLLASKGVAFDVTIVDQSKDDRTRDALQPLLHDPRLRYLRSACVGVANGRNLGIESAKTELIAVTDDDCEIPPDWLQKLVAVFRDDPDIGVVFGNVVPGPHDERAGFVTGYVRDGHFLARDVLDKLEVEGIAACLGFRKRVWQALFGFDAMLGLGARLRSAEETDFALRALRAGYYVFETSELAVIHHGFRPRQSTRDLTQRNWYGTGAVFGKHLKQHPVSTALLLSRLARRFVFRLSPVALSIGGPSHRMRKLVAFLRGLVCGLVISVDRKTGHFVRSKTPRT